MARFVARLILCALFGLVFAMTYFGLTNSNVQKADYPGMLKENKRQNRVPVYQKYNQNDQQRMHATDGIKRPPLAKVTVIYPVEKVPGLEEVARGQHEPEHHQNLEKNKTVELYVETDGHRLFQMPRMEGENIVSMTLYGSSPRYTLGAIRNAELIKINFPGWKLRIYTETPAASHYGAIPKNIMESLRALDVDFYFMQPGEDFIPPMMWRFLVADDIWVDRFIVRDADARLTQRDAAAVYAWVKSNKPFTCIRDHPSHAGYALSGGMWGARPRELRNVLRRSWRDLMRGVPSRYLDDMNFLGNIIWPKVQNHAYCLDSVSCDQWPGAHPFPIPRYGYEHVGQVVNEQDLGRPLDLQILKKAGENKKCTPPAKNKPAET